MKRFAIILPVFIFSLALFARPASALTISPVEKEYSVNPGDIVVEVLQLQNESTVATTIYPIAENFIGQGEGAGADFYSADEDPYGMAMAKWVKFNEGDEVITLEPGKRYNIAFTVTVPEDATPGGHYGAVVLSAVPPDQASYAEGMGLTRQLAFMMFYRVSGDIKESGGLAEFGFSKPKPWYNFLPIDFFARFENNGNVHLRPVGMLFIRDMFGRDVAKIAVNEKGRAVLPMSTRRFDFKWERGALDETKSGLTRELENFAFGKYTALLVLTYGYDLKTVQQEVTFFVWPWRLMTIVGVSLVVLILLLVVLVKLYNRALIAGYKRQLEREKKSK